jgi:hypothetical protein
MDADNTDVMDDSTAGAGEYTVVVSVLTHG